MNKTVVLVAAWDWVLFNFRMPIARALRSSGCEVILVAPPGDYVEALRSDGWDFEPWLVSRRGLNPLSQLASVMRLARIYRRRRVATALHFTMKPIYIGTLAARLGGVEQVVNTFTGLGYLFGSSTTARLLRTALVPFARVLFTRRRTRLVVQNPKDVEAIRSAGWIGPRVSVAVVSGSGVDLERFSPHADVHDTVVAVFAGRLLRSKGVADLEATARLLRQQGESVVVRILGEPDPGNPESLDEATLQQWRSEGLVQMPGHVDDVAAALAAADIAVLPSEREGLPRFLLEAAAAGLPSIATDVPGNRDVIDHEVTGLLVPPHDPKALCTAITRLASDPALRQRMGAAARKKAEVQFSDAAIADVYLGMVIGVTESEAS